MSDSSLSSHDPPRGRDNRLTADRYLDVSRWVEPDHDRYAHDRSRWTTHYKFYATNYRAGTHSTERLSVVFLLVSSLREGRGAGLSGARTAQPLPDSGKRGPGLTECPPVPSASSESPAPPSYPSRVGRINEKT